MNTYIIYTVSNKYTVKDCANEKEAINKLITIGVSEASIFRICKG